MIVFIMPPPEIKRVVSTTSDFQRTGVDILQVSANHQKNFALYEQLTAENGLTEWGRMGLEIKKPHYLQKREWLHCNDFVLNSTIDRLYEKL